MVIYSSTSFFFLKKKSTIFSSKNPWYLSRFHGEVLVGQAGRPAPAGAQGTAERALGGQVR